MDTRKQYSVFSGCHSLHQIPGKNKQKRLTFCRFIGILHVPTKIKQAICLAIILSHFLIHKSKVVVNCSPCPPVPAHKPCISLRTVKQWRSCNLFPKFLNSVSFSKFCSRLHRKKTEKKAEIQWNIETKVGPVTNIKWLMSLNAINIWGEQERRAVGKGVWGRAKQRCVALIHLGKPC